MRPLRCSIDITLDVWRRSRVMFPDEELHRYWAASLERADALLFGRTGSIGTRSSCRGTLKHPRAAQAGARRRDVRGGRDAPAGLGGSGIDRRVRVRGAGRRGGPRAGVVGRPERAGHRTLVGRQEFGSGAVALRYRPDRVHCVTSAAPGTWHASQPIGCRDRRSAYLGRPSMHSSSSAIAAFVNSTMFAGRSSSPVNTCRVRTSSPGPATASHA
jgi:hypothetical protein